MPISANWYKVANMDIIKIYLLTTKMWFFDLSRKVKENIAIYMNILSRHSKIIMIKTDIE